MYLGAASGTTVSHVSDIVGPVSTFHLFSCLDLYKTVFFCQIYTETVILRVSNLRLHVGVHEF